MNHNAAVEMIIEHSSSFEILIHLLHYYNKILILDFKVSIISL